MVALGLIVLLALVAGAVALVVVLVASLGRSPQPAAPAVARAARRHESLVSVAAAVVSVAATVGLLSLPVMPLSRGDGLRTSTFAIGSATSPYLGAVVFCLVRALGERTWPRPRGAVRTAPLTRRTVRQTGGWRLVVLAGTVGAGLLAVLVCGATATPDGQRVASPVVEGADGSVTWGSAGPYPGWHYGVPVAIGLAAVALAALLALRVLTRRPPLPLVAPAHDAEVRRVAAARLLAGAQLWTGIGVGFLLLFAALALRSADHPAGAATAGVLGGALLLGSMAVAATAVRTTGPRPAAGRGAAVDGVPA